MPATRARLITGVVDNGYPTRRETVLIFMSRAREPIAALSATLKSPDMTAMPEQEPERIAEGEFKLSRRPGTRSAPSRKHSWTGLTQNDIGGCEV